MVAGTKEIPTAWTTGWTDVLNTGTWRSAIPVHQKGLSPCQVICPAGGEIPVWLDHIKKEEYHQAWLTLAKNNPFPAITGRVCHHPCEGSCNRKEYDGAVTINALEQFIGDLALKEGWSLPQPPTNKNIRIAIVGGGPAGLSCAYHLRMQGYSVTVFEEQPELGGVLRYGIPPYRLPKQIINREIQRLLETGIEVRNVMTVRGDDMPALQKEYAAICLAIGAPRAKMLPQFSASDSRVFNGLNFLSSINQNNIPPIGQQVAVIGGGSVAMDVARSARRLGKKVMLLALEDMQSLPAQSEEVQEALEEGIIIHDGVMVDTTADHNNQLKLSCVKVALDPTAPPGELRPAIIHGTNFEIFADTVILAVGQDAELNDFSNIIEVTNSIIEINDEMVTSKSGIFACGDVATHERYVSVAVGGGKQVANNINAFIEGKFAANKNVASPAKQISYKDINTFYFPATAREEHKKLDPEQRLQDFREVKIGLSEDEAKTQAERCFSCGNCLKCDNCYYYCPDMAIIKDSSCELGYRIQDQYCKGCGLCVEECPRGAVLLEEVVR